MNNSHLTSIIAFKRSLRFLITQIYLIIFLFFPMMLTLQSLGFGYRDLTEPWVFKELLWGLPS